MKCEEQTTGKQEKSVSVSDPDPHPLAALHEENFRENSKILSMKWFLGDTEQREVISLQKPAIRTELRRSERIRRSHSA